MELTIKELIYVVLSGLGIILFMFGFCWLFVKMVKKTRKKQPNLDIKDKEIKIIRRAFTSEEMLEVVKVLQNENINKIYVRKDEGKHLGVLNVVDFDIRSLNFRFTETLFPEYTVYETFQ